MSAYRELEGRFRRMAALGEAAGMLHWDMSVLMPPGGAPAHADTAAERMTGPKKPATITKKPPINGESRRFLARETGP